MTSTSFRMTEDNQGSTRDVVIICAGDFPRREYPRWLITNADAVVVCDSAFKTWLANAPKLFGGEVRLPYAVVGDMDSLSPSLQRKYASIMEKVEEQDDNDQTKAFRYVMEHFPEAASIHILGATGRREDHTIGNMSLLMEYQRMFDLSCKAVEIVSDYTTSFAVADTCTLAVGEGRRISIFSPDNSLKITSKGLHWPTDEVVFDNWWKATLNRADSDLVTLTFSHPSQALIVLS